MVEMKIIETLSEYQMIKEQAKFSFGSESCAPCKALKEKLCYGAVHIHKC